METVTFADILAWLFVGWLVLITLGLILITAMLTGADIAVERWVRREMARMREGERRGRQGK